jgi:hypothetical protein
VTLVTRIAPAPQMLCPKRCECLASHQLSLPSVFLVCEDFLVVVALWGVSKRQDKGNR